MANQKHAVAEKIISQMASATSSDEVVLTAAQANLLAEVWKSNELAYCQLSAIFGNKVAEMGAMAIELEKGSTESAKDWLYEALAQADCPTWQVYDDAEAFYNSYSFDYPQSVEEHRQNVEILNQIIDEDEAKLDQQEPRHE